MGAGKVMADSAGVLEIANVPRYYEPYVCDCFTNAYGALLQHRKLDPAIGLADYLNFMYDPQIQQIGINFLHGYSDTVLFTEEELNSSMPFAYLPPTSVYDEAVAELPPGVTRDRVCIRQFVHDDPAVADARLQDKLRQGEPVSVVVNLHNIHYHRAYGTQHGIHALVVTGYDAAADEYLLFDKYAMSSSDFDGRLSKQELMTARNALCDMSNPLVGERARQVRHLWMELEADPELAFKEEQARVLMAGSLRRMKGEEQVLGVRCGFPALVLFCSDLAAKADQPFDERERFRFRFNYYNALKSVGRQRKRFLAFLAAADEAYGWNTLAQTRDWLTAAALHWDIAANLSLKLGLTAKLPLLAELTAQIGLAHKMEQQFIAWLEEWEKQR